MKVLVQRVSRAEVRVDGRVVGQIARGLVVLLGVEKTDTLSIASWYARRIAAMKFFADEQGHRWRCCAKEVAAEVLVVSQFTLAAQTRKGRRPSFDPAAAPELAEMLYEHFLAALETAGLPIARGVFGAQMEVELVNDGPVTFLLEGPSETSGGAH